MPILHEQLLSFGLLDLHGSSWLLSPPAQEGGSSQSTQRSRLKLNFWLLEEEGFELKKRWKDLGRTRHRLAQELLFLLGNSRNPDISRERAGFERSCAEKKDLCQNSHADTFQQVPLYSE